MQKITYIKALNDLLHEVMAEDEKVFIIGQGVRSPWYVGGLCNDLAAKWPDRVIDTPVSENAVTGAAVGAAIAGMKPIVVYPRHDFMLYAMDPIINHAAKWHYLFQRPVPIVFFAILNRGGCQGPHHSQDFTWLFSNIPGLKVVRPLDGYSAKGVLRAAIEDPNPVVFIDDRWLYDIPDKIPEIPYTLPVDFYRVQGDVSPWCPVPCSKPLEEEYYERLESTVHQLS